MMLKLEVKVVLVIRDCQSLEVTNDFEPGIAVLEEDGTSLDHEASGPEELFFKHEISPEGESPSSVLCLIENGADL